MTDLALIDAAKLDEPSVEQLRELTRPPQEHRWRDAHAIAWRDSISISTMKPAQPCTRPESVMFAKLPVTFTEIRTMQTRSSHHDPI